VSIESERQNTYQRTYYARNKAKHRAAAKAYQASLVARGLCRSGCGRALSGKTLCGVCALKNALHVQRSHYGSAPALEDVLAVYAAQNGRCYYTGEPVSWGVNASVDHIVPRAQGGSDEVSNIRVVSLWANRAKSDLSEDRFLASVRLIAQRFAT
jgi:5-methylcytosine-specific restriction endonuclease McrA